MSTSIVVDVGNSRMKWGRCEPDRVAEAAALPLDRPEIWQEQWRQWDLTPEVAWTLAGVNPPVIHQLADWLRSQRAVVRLLEHYQQLPLEVNVEAPEQVGIDRLLNAVAANAKRTAGAGAVIIDAGSAVTVNWVDESGVFRGGAIFPGLRLMAKALSAFTAKLPEVPVSSPTPMPGASTAKAIQAGVFGAVVGGIEKLLWQLLEHVQQPPCIFLTGGDAHLVAPAVDARVEIWPNMTLEGIRLAARNI